MDARCKMAQIEIVVHQSDLSSRAPRVSINASGEHVRIIAREEGMPDCVLFTGERFNEGAWRAQVKQGHRKECKCCNCYEVARREKGGRE